jgi:hypothetical protein
MRNTHIILVVKSERKRSLGRPVAKTEDNIKIDLKERRWKMRPESVGS